MVPCGPDDVCQFVAVPFFGRIRNGRFKFERMRIALPVNAEEGQHPMHGHGRSRPWRLVRQSAAACSLSYEHQPDAWPWRYRATQTFTLDGRALSVEVTLQNQSEQVMPFGLGLHPYFPVERSTTVRASAAGMCELDQDGLTVGKHRLETRGPGGRSGGGGQ